jgi:protein-tyrosine-phosphatase
VFKILFVCTGNSCRSPMAEGILKHLLREQGIKDILVESAGTHSPQGMPPTQNTILVTTERGIDIMSHRARMLTSEMIEDADLILVMEKSHTIFIRNHFPRGKHKTHLLKTFSSEDYEEDVYDPIGGDLNIYRSCVEELDKEIRRVFPEIIHRADQNKSS